MANAFFTSYSPATGTCREVSRELPETIELIVSSLVGLPRPCSNMPMSPVRAARKIIEALPSADRCFGGDDCIAELGAAFHQVEESYRCLPGDNSVFC
jgi:hypothetical protein